MMFKGGHGGGSGGRRGLWNVYLLTVVIVMVIFSVIILGLMGIQRIRERNVFNLQIKQKDDQILSLHILLQKEREHFQEDKRKFQEMKMKIYSLRAQKTGLNTRLLEMESMVSSLKEEQKTIESAFEDKQNEAKLFKEKYTLIKDQIQHKEAEIQDLKHRLQPTTGSGNEYSTSTESSRDNVGSISNDDVSRHKETESSTNTEERGRNEGLGEKRGDIIGKEQYEKLENSLEQKVKNGRTDPLNGESNDTGKNKNEYEIEMTRDLEDKESNPRNEDREAHIGDGRRLEIEHDMQLKNSNSEVSEDQVYGMHRGGVKMELQENFQSKSTGYIGNHNHLNRATGNRWRSFSREIGGNLNTKSNGAAFTRGQRFSKGASQVSNIFDKEKPSNKAKVNDLSTGMNPFKNEHVSNNQYSEVKQRNVKTKPRGYTEETTGDSIEDSPPGIKLRDSRKLTDIDDMSQNAAKADVGISQQVEKAGEGILTNSSSMKLQVSTNDVPKNISGSSNQGKLQHLEKYKQFKEQGFITEQHMDNNNDNPGQTKVIEKNEYQDYIEMRDFEDTELGRSNSKETVPTLEADSEEY